AQQARAAQERLRLVGVPAAGLEQRVQDDLGRLAAVEAAAEQVVVRRLDERGPAERRRQRRAAGQEARAERGALGRLADLDADGLAPEDECDGRSVGARRGLAAEDDDGLQPAALLQLARARDEPDVRWQLALQLGPGRLALERELGKRGLAGGRVCELDVP